MSCAGKLQHTTCRKCLFCFFLLGCLMQNTIDVSTKHLFVFHSLKNTYSILKNSEDVFQPEGENKTLIPWSLTSHVCLTQFCYREVAPVTFTFAKQTMTTTSYSLALTCKRLFTFWVLKTPEVFCEDDFSDITRYQMHAFWWWEKHKTTLLCLAAASSNKSLIEGEKNELKTLNSGEHNEQKMPTAWMQGSRQYEVETHHVGFLVNIR